MSIRPLAVFHKSDLDGVCSGAIVKHFVPDVELYGFDYGEDFPWDIVEFLRDPESEVPVDGCPDLAAGVCPRRTVYLVDVSLPPEDMKRLAEVSNLVWVDHHKTALKAWFGADTRPKAVVVGDIRYAACELVWMYFQDGADVNEYLNDDTHTLPAVPEAVRLLGRYDVWAKDDPEWESKIRPFQMGARSVPGIYDPKSMFWTYQFQNAIDKDGFLWVASREDRVMLNPEWTDLVAKGRAILRYQAEVNRRAMETGAHELNLTATRWFDVSGDPCAFELGREDIRGEQITVRALACNTIVFNSQFFEGFYDPEKHDVMCAYCQLADGRWKVSLYSTKPEIDCGAICKTFGGGGHKGAAGFICDKLPWG